MRFIFGSHKVNGYCAFCRSSRWHYKNRSLGIIHVILSLVVSSVVSFYVFNELNPKLLLFFVVGLCVSETFTQIRWRMSLVCKQCGFDPVIYKRDPGFAAKLVKKRLEKRQESTSIALRPLHLPALTPERAATLQKIENQPRLSKQI